MSDPLIQKPEPEQTIDSEGYWRAAAAGQLELTRCTACDNVFHYPRPLCPSCGSWEVESIIAAGRGVVYSFTVVHRAPSPAFRPDAPYVLALVDTLEGARLLTAVRNVDPDAMQIGLPVEVRFEPRGATAIPVFVPVAIAS